jgi:hypothetical protein
MSNNLGSTGTLATETHDLATEMAAYDSLPPDARKAIREAPVPICATAIAMSIARGAPAWQAAPAIRQFTRAFLASSREERGWPA